MKTWVLFHWQFGFIQEFEAGDEKEAMKFLFLWAADTGNDAMLYHFKIKE